MLSHATRHVRRGVAIAATTAAGALTAACAGTPAPRTTDAIVQGATDASRPIATATGFSGPEAVRYDADQDVYFVSNFNGSGTALDSNGFISRLRPDGTVDALRFIAGGERGVVLHAPRGMAIVGDTLWVADVDAVRAFHRKSGAPLASVPFAVAEVGFLNDVAPGADGALYVTDTGRNRIYRLSGGQATVALEDSALGAPNGITWDSAGGRFLVVPYGGAHTIHAWRPGTTTLETVGTSAGAKFDGVEVIGPGRVLVASQADSSLHLFAAGSGRAVVRTAGPPADIGVDTRRDRVAVPFIALGSVEIWAVPRQ
jgi:sugar lactone lactonase YvrE